MSQDLEEDFLMLSMKYAASTCPASALVHCTGDSNLWSSDEAPSAYYDSDWLHQQYLHFMLRHAFSSWCVIYSNAVSIWWRGATTGELLGQGWAWDSSDLDLSASTWSNFLPFGSRCLTLRRSWTSGQWWIIRYGLLCGHGGRMYIDVEFLIFTWNCLVRLNAASHGSFGFNGRSCINVWHFFCDSLWWHYSFSCSTCVTWSLLHLVFGLVCFCGSRCCHDANYFDY